MSKKLTLIALNFKIQYLATQSQTTRRKVEFQRLGNAPARVGLLEFAAMKCETQPWLSRSP
jgi:hypothetical protein